MTEKWNTDEARRILAAGEIVMREIAEAYKDVPEEEGMAEIQAIIDEERSRQRTSAPLGSEPAPKSAQQP